ncbi:MAG: DUF3791 domain-containing protein [Eubacteriales bacterium]
MKENEMEFIIFCIENIAMAMGKEGQEVYRLLTYKKNIVKDYILSNYEILHTQSKEYIIEDIIKYMIECGVLE